jgi:RND family efflux transporter MFP subunit
VRAALPLCVLAAGALVAIVLVKTSPKAERKPPARQARLVEVQPIRFESQRTVVYAMGTVQPAREVELRPRVSGEIVAVSEEFLPGGRFLKGQTVLQIDPTDYELAVRQRESDVADAHSDLALELGQQSVAKREYELLGEKIAEEDRGLVLRQPQLEKVRAKVEAAEAALEQARLNLDRTHVRAPFNALVRTREVNVGMQVTTANTLATLIGTDEYWIEATLPVDQLRWVEIANGSTETGSQARVLNEAAWGPHQHRTGRVIRLLSDLEEEGRMARLLVAVRDPLGLEPGEEEQPRLLLGDYVRIEIEGKELGTVAALDRRHIRGGDRVWIMNKEDRLEIRHVAIAYRGREYMFVTNGVHEGERLVTTDLPAPVEGMLLRTQNETSPAESARETAS